MNSDSNKHSNSSGGEIQVKSRMIAIVKEGGMDGEDILNKKGQDLEMIKV